MEPPPQEWVKESWPYSWQPTDRDHALYEARFGGQVQTLVGLLSFVVGIYLATADPASVGLNRPGLVIVGFVVIVAGVLQVLSGLRYSMFCYWWAGESPWWMRPPSPFTLIEVSFAKAGNVVAALDRFGRKYAGILALLSVLGTVLALALSR